MYKDIRKRRIDKTVDEVKYFVLNCSLFNNFGSEGITGHPSVLDRDVETFLLEQKPTLRKRTSNYLSFQPQSISLNPTPLAFLTLKLYLSYYMVYDFPVGFGYSSCVFLYIPLTLLHPIENAISKPNKEL